MSQRVLVTGGSGKLGQAVIYDLLANDYQVINADLNRLAGVPFINLNLTDLGDVYESLSGIDAVIHLAAIPSPHGYPPARVFTNNTLGTYHLLQVCTQTGVHKVVMASSLSALGLAYCHRPVQLQQFPISEAHPNLAQDAYGLSKHLGEEMANAFARRDENMSLFSFRFPLLVTPEEKDGVFASYRKNLKTGAPILWSYLDTRDAAIVIRQALNSSKLGHHALYVNYPYSFADVPTLELLRKFYHNVPITEEHLNEFGSPIDCTRAYDLLGFQPVHT